MPRDIAEHRERHTRGILPYDVREFIKRAAYAAIEAGEDVETARLAIAYMWYHREREAGRRPDFDRYIADALADMIELAPGRPNDN